MKHTTNDKTNHKTDEAKMPESARPDADERFAAFRSFSDPELEAERRHEQERRRKIHSFLRTEYAKLSLYIILTFLVIYLIWKVGDHLPALLGAAKAGLGMFWTVLRPLIGGIVLAYLLYPLMMLFKRWLEKAPYFRRHRGHCRGIATAVTLILAVGMVLLALSTAFSMVTHQLRMVNFDDLTSFITSLASSLNEMYKALAERLAQANISSEALSSLADYLSNWFGSFTANLGTQLTSSLSHMTGFIANMAIALIFAIYFLLDTEGLEAYWDRVLRAVTDRRAYRGIHLLLQDVDSVFSGYIRGQIIDAFFMFIMVSVALSLMGIRFSLIIGIMTGIGNLVPYLGPFFAYGSTIIVCLITGDFQKMIASLIVLFIIQTIDGNVINPKLLSNAIHVHPMLVILALTAGSAAGGILGMLVAVPVAALLKIWFDRIVSLLLERKQARKVPEGRG